MSIASVVAESESEPERLDPVSKDRSLGSENPDAENRGCFGESGSELKLSLKGKDGRCLVLELEPGILSESSALLAAILSKSGRQVPDASGDSCKIEFSGLENVDVFKETIELMYAKDAARWLIKGGVSRAIDILEVRGCFQLVNPFFHPVLYLLFGTGGDILMQSVSKFFFTRVDMLMQSVCEIWFGQI